MEAFVSRRTKTFRARRKGGAGKKAALTPVTLESLSVRPAVRHAHSRTRTSSAGRIPLSLAGTDLLFGEARGWRWRSPAGWEG